MEITQTISIKNTGSLQIFFRPLGKVFRCCFFVGLFFFSFVSSICCVGLCWVTDLAIAPQ